MAFADVVAAAHPGEALRRRKPASAGRARQPRMDYLANCLHDLTALGPGGAAGGDGGAVPRGARRRCDALRRRCAGPSSSPRRRPWRTGRRPAAWWRGCRARRCCPITWGGCSATRRSAPRRVGWPGWWPSAPACASCWRRCSALAALLMFAQASRAPRRAAAAAARATAAAPGWNVGSARCSRRRPGCAASRSGLMLSALPCGLLYGALAGAAATGSALGGALAMAAFVTGTVPALVGRGAARALLRPAQRAARCAWPAPRCSR